MRAGFEELPLGPIAFLQEIADGTRRVKRRVTVEPVKQPREKEWADIEAALSKPTRHNGAGGPAKALARLKETLHTDAEKDLWLLEAEKAAVLSSCPKTLGSVRYQLCCAQPYVFECAPPLRSGMRAWMQFSKEVLRDKTDFPPTLRGLLAWSSNFRRACDP